MLPLGYRLITWAQDHGYQRGVGIVVAPRLDPFLSRYWSVGERIGFAEFVFLCNKNNSNCKPTHNTARVISAYGPTAVSYEGNPSLKEEFYSALSTVWKDSTRSGVLCFIAGDFNSKVGICKRAHGSKWLSSFSRGARNDNGQHMLEWSIENDAFLANTAFQHRQRHRTTWTGCLGVEKLAHNLSTTRSILFFAVRNTSHCCVMHVAMQAVRHQRTTEKSLPHCSFVRYFQSGGRKTRQLDVASTPRCLLRTPRSVVNSRRR